MTARKPAPPKAKSKPPKTPRAPALGHRLKISPVADIRSEAAPALPPVGTVSLEGLVAPTVEPVLPTEDELLEEYVLRVRRAAPHRPRAAKELLEAGDEVTVDLIAFASEALVPFSFRHRLTTALVPSAAWPGLFEQLVGVPVGDSLTVKVTLPADSPAKDFAGKPVDVTVVVHAAQALTFPEGGIEAAFATLELGPTFAATLEALYRELATERVEDAVGRRTARVLEAFAQRWSEHVPATLLDAELEKSWAKAEGAAMVEVGLPPDVQRQALAQFRADPATRADVEGHLRLELALRALGEADPPKLTQASVLEALDPFAEELGFTREQLESALTADKGLTTELAAMAYRLMLVRRVLAAAKPS
jgi:FKBP-type peptidyl-prolyl cis-trans isomerase (trigger factor)